MINEYLKESIEIGTVLKESYEGEPDCYYLVGPYFIYCNDYDYPSIRPHKFIFDEHISVASEEEKTKFLNDLKKNHLIVNENYEIQREFTDVNVTVKVRVNTKITKDELINKLNKYADFSEIVDIIQFKFVDF